MCACEHLFICACLCLQRAECEGPEFAGVCVRPLCLLGGQLSGLLRSTRTDVSSLLAGDAHTHTTRGVYPYFFVVVWFMHKHKCM